MSKKTPLKTTKTATKKANAKLKKGEAGWIQPMSSSTKHDFMTILLIVSLALNFAVLIAWVIVRSTSAYDAEVFNFLFNR